MINPKVINWIGSSEREDNTPYLVTDRRGYNVVLQVAGTPAPAYDAVPLYTAISGAYDFSLDMTLLGEYPAEGDYEFYVQDEDVDGRKSVWSAPYAFSVVVANPKPVTGFSAS